MKWGGWSNGANAYRIHHFGNCNPLIDMQWVYAGEKGAQAIYTGPTSGGIWEPYPGSAVTGVGGTIQSGTSNYFLWAARWRYLQKRDAYGNWYTIAQP